MAGKPKKALWKRWWVWVGGFVVLIIIISSLGNGGASSTPTTAAAGGTPKTTAHKPKSVSSKIGTPVNIGKLTVTVHTVTFEKSINSALGTLGAKGGVWMVVNLTVKNNDTTAHTLDPALFTALKGKSQYQASETADMYINSSSNTFFLSSINPGLEQTGNIAFDVASQGTYQMQVSGGFLSLASGTINLTK